MRIYYKEHDISEGEALGSGCKKYKRRVKIENGEAMVKEGENRVFQVVQNLLSAQTVPESTNVSLNSICQLYGFDRARSFIRVIGTDQFVALDEANYGKEPCVHIEKNGVDFKQSYYRKDKALSHEMMDLLIREKFIHTCEFKKFQGGLEMIGFIPSEGETVMEVCLKCVSSSDIGIMGYFVFERFDSNTKLTEGEIAEVQALCEITNGRIENFETRKQLRDEELYNVMDRLTGLPLLKKFKNDVEMMLPQAEQYAMLSMDIDKFKYINEIWSHETGDDILVKLAEVIALFARAEDKYCRIGDDKFAIFFQYDDEQEIKERLDNLKKEFAVLQKKYFSDVKISIIGGVYLVQDDINANLIIDKANIARRSCKGAFENTFAIYNKNLENLSEWEKQLERRMGYALEHSEFVPYLQPKFNLFTNEICGAEALVRWVTKERVIPPAEFIPTFEKNGFITRLDFIVYESIFQFIQNAIKKGCNVYPISLNVSREHMKENYFLEKFIALMDQYQIPHELIEVEITESIFMEDEGKLSQFIEGIREQGVSVSIDDFGTAYSSLNLLKNVDVDVVKLDKSFIDNITWEKSSELMNKDKVIIRNIVTMINELQFKTIFEGIERREQVEFLKGIGCEYGQGYIFACPISLQEFEKQFMTP